MSTNLSVFNFNENTAIRTTLHDNNVWFVAKDLAEALEYASPDKAYQFCKQINSANSAELNKINNLPPATKWIPESDMYRLIMRSNKAEAETFQDWVVEEVLPTIRKTGSYSSQQKPLTANEILAQSAMALVEHDKRLAATEIEVKQVAAKVAQISVDLRNGVPHGFISRKNAKSLYAKGLSQTIFEEAMTALAVPTQSYVSFGDGYSTPTFAYQEDHIPTAIAHFIRDLEQKTSCQCFSRVLNKRVNYVKIPNYGLKQLSQKTDNQQEA